MLSQTATAKEYLISRSMGALIGLILASIIGQSTAAAEPCTQKNWFRITRQGRNKEMRSCFAENPKFLNQEDEAGCTALVNAAANKNVEMVQMLTDIGADVNLACRSGNTAMAYAAKFGNLGMCKILHAHNANFDAFVGTTSRTPLDIAALAGHWDVVKFLHGVEISLTESWTGNDLMFAAAKGEVSMIKALMAKGGNNLEDTDHHGNTALLWASRTGKVASVKTLLAKGSNIHAASKSGWTSLMQAAYHGHLEVVKLLQLHGATRQIGAAFVETTDKVGYTAVHWAAIQGHVEILTFLHGVGADVGSAASTWTPLMLATQQGHNAAAKYILRRGVSWTMENNQGDTCEALACRSDNDEMCSTFKRMREATNYEHQRQQQRRDRDGRDL